MQPACPTPGWRFWIDRGGTFTDVVGCSPAGELVVRKVLSVQPECPGDPAVRAIGAVLAWRLAFWPATPCRWDWYGR